MGNACCPCNKGKDGAGKDGGRPLPTTTPKASGGESAGGTGIGEATQDGAGIELPPRSEDPREDGLIPPVVAVEVPGGEEEEDGVGNDDAAAPEEPPQGVEPPGGVPAPAVVPVSAGGASLPSEGGEGEEAKEAPPVLAAAVTETKEDPGPPPAGGEPAPEPAAAPDGCGVVPPPRLPHAAPPLYRPPFVPPLPPACDVVGNSTCTFLIPHIPPEFLESDEEEEDEGSGLRKAVTAEQAARGFLPANVSTYYVRDVVPDDEFVDNSHTIKGSVDAFEAGLAQRAVFTS